MPPHTPDNEQIFYNLFNWSLFFIGQVFFHLHFILKKEHFKSGMAETFSHSPLFYLDLLSFLLYNYVILYSYRCISVWLYSRIVIYVSIRIYKTSAVLSLLYFSFYLSFHFVSVLDHSLFFFVCSHLSTFKCKGSTGRKHGKHQFLIDNKFFKTLRNQIDYGFLKNLLINYLPYFPFCQYSYLAHKRFEMTVTPE